MTDRDIFHEATLDLGGRDDSRTTQSSTMEILAKQVIHAYSTFIPRMPEVHFDFISNQEINARAFQAEGRYFIGVYSGLVSGLSMMFFTMLSDRRFFPNVGNIELESSENQCGFSAVMPRCPTRVEYAYRLLQWAYRFLILHELAHIFDGHVDYVKAKYGIACLPELGWTGNTEYESELITLQTLEAIADSQAAGNLIDNARACCNNEMFPLPLDHTVFMMTFAFFSFFRLFGDKGFSEHNLIDDHPPDRIRQQMCIKKAMEVIRIWPESVDLCLTALKDAGHEVEWVFSLIDGQPAMAGLQQAFSLEGIAYVEKIFHHIVSVTEPALAPFRYHDLVRG
jgi:hypothetical protein